MPRDLSVEGASIVVVGLFRTASGIGRSARLCAEGLRKQGLSPICVDLSEAFNQVDLPARSDYALPDDVEVQTAPVILIHLNAPEIEAAIYYMKLKRGRARYIIAYWAWELTVVPDSWVPAMRYISEIWVPSKFVARAVLAKIDCRVTVVPHMIDSCCNELGKSGIRAGNEILCLVLADGNSSFARKNVITSINSFITASQGTDARLVVKVRNLSKSATIRSYIEDVVSCNSRVQLLESDLTDLEQGQLLADIDILISLHRSEGFGLPIAEAMALGKAVIATGWSGNTDFMTNENSFLVPYEVVPVEDPYGIYSPGGGGQSDLVWAAPLESAASEMLRQLIQNSKLRVRLGARARADLVPLTEGEAYADALRRTFACGSL